jgi:hypothetical protein
MAHQAVVSQSSPKEKTMHKSLLRVLVALFLLATAGAWVAAAESPSYSAHLAGRNEVPPADTLAQGQAHFKLNHDGTAIEYKLIAANIENITQAHIHMAPEGVNGPVVAWLYPSAPPSQLIPDRFNGVLAEGVITADNLVGPLAGASLQDLLDAMNHGNSYVNVHTSQFPGGEIRGQIR